MMARIRYLETFFKRPVNNVAVIKTQPLPETHINIKEDVIPFVLGLCEPKSKSEGTLHGGSFFGPKFK